MSQQSQQPKSAYQSILEWSTNRPDWQRDALRRIVLGADITENEVMNWERQCRQKHGVTFSGIVEPLIPLEVTHIAASANAADAVSLLSVGSLRNVNRLPTAQTLTFAPAPGLTIVYGDNGCGKSGYARVIKKACRSRGSAPNITHNVFDAKPATPATGTIKFNAGGVDDTVTWEDGKASDSRLANVFVFDTNTASHYLAEDGPACFTPLGLDVLPMLSKLCDVLSKRLKDERAKLVELNSTAAKQWTFATTTEVGAFIANLSASTVKTRLAALAQLTDADTSRLAVLQSALASNAQQKAKATRASATRLRTMSERITRNAAILSESNLTAMEKLINDTVSAKSAADNIATKTFAEGFVAATGSTLWRALWEGARNFSNEAYPEHQFPLTDEDLRCLLCQQPMTADTQARLQKFEQFCKDTGQQRADNLLSQLSKQLKEISGLNSLKSDSAKIDADLTVASEELRQQIDAYVDAADTALDTLKSNLKSLLWTKPVAIPTSPASEIETLIKRLEEQVKTEEQANDPQLHQAMMKERNELADRRLLSTVQSQVSEQIDRWLEIQRIDECIRECDTAPITRLNTELSEQLINEQYRRQFKDEIKRIGVSTIDVALEDIGGKKGTTKFGLRLVNAKDHQVRQIASEGEQRCLALAAFLAELALASHKSAIVFDDPVSSLDITHCRGISMRIAEEAKQRQVIVFTHNVVFLSDLASAAKELDLTPTYRCIEWEGSSPGACRDGLPWMIQTPNERLAVLEQARVALAKKWNAVPNAQDRLDIGHLYGLLRATIERVVEIYVLDNTVTRFRAYLPVAKLKAVIGFTQAEYDELHRLFEKASSITVAHDDPAANPAILPTPAGLKTDMDALEAVIKVIVARTQANQKKKPIVQPVAPQKTTP